jgi:ABC-type Co2+ transport system permease subunit
MTASQETDRHAVGRKIAAGCRRGRATVVAVCPFVVAVCHLSASSSVPLWWISASLWTEVRTMHIEPGLLTGAKMAVAYATGTAALTATLIAAARTLRRERRTHWPYLGLRALIAFVIVLTAFEWLPHPSVGVSEVHLILGSTLFLLFGFTPAAIGLAAALFCQGVWFAPDDLPQYFANVTTILAPLFAVATVARRTIHPATPYVDLRYRDVFRLSLTYQGGVVAWVAFWALLGLGSEAVVSIATFAAGYLVVLLIEPALDLALLALAKSAHRTIGATPILASHLFARA